MRNKKKETISTEKIEQRDKNKATLKEPRIRSYTGVLLGKLNKKKWMKKEKEENEKKKEKKIY